MRTPFFRTYPKYKWALAINDFIVFHLSFFISLKIRYSWNPESFFVKQYAQNDFFKLGIILYSVLCIFYFQYANMYKIHSIFKRGVHAFLILKSTFFVLIGFIVFHFLFFYIELQSRAFFGIWFIVMPVLMLLSRLPFVDLVSRISMVKDKIVIIGADSKGRRLFSLYKRKVEMKEVIGYLDDMAGYPQIDGVPLLGKIEDAEKIAKTHHIDYFILAIDDLKRERFFEVLKQFQSANLPLYVSSKYLRALYERLNLDRLGDYGMVRFNSEINTKLFLYIKRVFDIVLSLIAIILFTPLLMITGLAVKFTSKGSVIYKQIRIGKYGRPFYFYKFRTMYVNSDKDVERRKNIELFIKGEFVSDNGSKKIVNQLSITPVGRFLRKYSLDEMPQLFNVLLGNMSLVGSRPCTLSEWKLYEDWQKQRLDFVPGCTGVWQVCGRSEVSFEENVLMDIYYNQNYSPWFDLKIMLKTVKVIISGKGGG